MNNELQQVVNVCIALNEAGKKPSVGMLRAKLLSPLPIPTIIKGLSYWKENKATVKTQQIAEPTPPPARSGNDLAIRVAQLENVVVTLKNELKTLQQRFEDEGS
ncbi:MAG: hypothetical protein ACI9IT_002630 [Glaciecola sp.]|jgi:hypothetical protein